MISVIIPLYNKEASIKQSLMSVLSQSYQDFEVVIVDDGSTDNSVTKVEEIQDSRIRLIRQENGGPGKARNTGVKNARGEWIVLLDADDELLPNALSIFSKAINDNSYVDIFDANKYILVGDTKTLGYHPIQGRIEKPFEEWFFGRISPGNGTSAFRRSFFRNYLFDEHIRRFEDAALLMKQLPFARVYSLTQPTMLFNRNFAEASRPRQNVLEDYFAYLDFSQGGFWQRMCTYRLFLENRELYPEFGKVHYAKMYKRYDWLLVYKLLNWFGKYFK